jgi:hypothetical protein
MGVSDVETRSLERKGGDAPNDIPLGPVARRNPQTEDILIFPDTEHNSVDLFSRSFVLFATDSVSDQRENDFLPYSVRDTFPQSQNPSSSSNVRCVLPRGSDRRAEDVIVTDDVNGMRCGFGGIGIEDSEGGMKGGRESGRRNEVSEEWVKRFNLHRRSDRLFS